MPLGCVAPAEALVVLDPCARRRDVALVSRDRRPCRRGRARCARGRRRGGRGPRPARGPPCPLSQWVRIGQPVRAWARAAAAKTRSSRGDGPAVGARDLHDAGTVRRPLHDGPAVVELVDAVLDVGHEEVGKLVGRQAYRPVAIVVVALMVEPRRSDDVDAAAARDLGQHEDVPAAVGGHGVDDRAQTQRLSRRKLGDGLVRRPPAGSQGRAGRGVRR